MLQTLLGCFRWLSLITLRTLEGVTSGAMGSGLHHGMVGKQGLGGLESLEGRVNPAPLMVRPLNGMPLTEHLMQDANLVAPAPAAPAPIQVSTHTGMGLITEITPRISESVVDNLFCSLAETSANEGHNRLSALDKALVAVNTESEQLFDYSRHESHVDSAVLGWALAGGALMTTWWVGNDERYTKQAAALRLAA